ncbi:MAG: oligopeptide/dipeptide ABC transporter ATP-binding protein [Halodesulfurarchaeum sp.]
MTGSEETSTAGDTTGPDPVLSVKGLEKHYPIRSGWLRRQTGTIRAVDGVSFDISAGEAFGLVGESGSGKSTLAETILGLEAPTAGTIRFHGETVRPHRDPGFRDFSRRVQLIVQDPNEAFNPRMTVGEAVAEPLRLHGLDDEERRELVVTDMLERVGLSAADAERYPHEFSGGEKQRIAIARALVPNPDLIIADEPTSALDKRVESDVLALLEQLRRDHDIAILFISHDIDVVGRFCNRVAVMYLGEIVERGAAEAILDAPAHPYTRLLVSSVPGLTPGDWTPPSPLTDITPDPSDPPSGCSFHPRCVEVIAPTDLAVPVETWRQIAAFHFSLRSGALPESLDGKSASGELDAETVRDAFSLPPELPDASLDRTVDAAIAAFLDGGAEAALDRLDAALETSCSAREPTAVSVGDRTVKCHRYDDRFPADPLDWAEKSEDTPP